MTVEEDWLRDMVESYGSLSTPDFRFALARYRKKPYVWVVDRLRAEFEVQETTDLNDDVAVMLALSGAEGMCGLLLSLVGAYAAATDEEGVLLEAIEDERVALLLESVRISFVPRSSLRREFVFGQEKKTLYEILFSADGAERLSHGSLQT